MKANDVTLSQIFESAFQFLIPVFQRYYSWEEENWKQLWEDITELSENEERKESHFMGSLVFVPRQEPGHTPVYQVIDGQQRIITLSLLLCGLRDVARKRGYKIGRKIHDTYIVRPYEEDDEHFRVFPRLQDREEYKNVVLSRSPKDPDASIHKAHCYFVRRIQEDLPEEERAIENLFNLLKQQVDFVQINLDANENPFQIFSSLNSTGVDLGEGDLIRNFVFMSVDLDDQDQFDRKFWTPLEDLFREEDELKDRVFSNFFRHFLLKEGEYIPKNSTFKAFEERYQDDLDAKCLTEELIRFARFHRIVRGEEEHASNDVNIALRKLNALNSSTSYPLLLKLMDWHDRGRLSERGLAMIIERVASFILRRLVCGESSKAYYRWFPTACRKMDENPQAEIVAYLESKGYPDDDRFTENFVTFDLYKSNYVKAVLEALERDNGHREAADLSGTQVEHIMPQKLSDQWLRSLGEDSERIHMNWLHTPGNLTLSAYNKELFNHPFEEKKVEYNRSNVTLTRNLTKYDTWGEEQIRERGRALAKRAKDIWPGPYFD